jgi:hypothetical protein
MAKQQRKGNNSKSTGKNQDVRMVEGIRGVSTNALDEIKRGGTQGLNEMRAGFESAWEEISMGLSKAGQTLFDSLMKAKDSLFMQNQNKSGSSQSGSSYQQ